MRWRRAVGEVLAHGRRRVEHRTLRTGDDDEVAVGLEARRDGPFDLQRVMHLHVVVDHDHLLEVVVRAERRADHVFGLALVRLADLDVEVVAADAADGEVHVQHVGKAALQMREQRGLARDRAQQQVLHLGRHDGVVDRVAPVRDGLDLDHLAVLTRAVVPRELAEGALGLANAGQDAALDHDLAVGRHPHFARQALDHLQGCAVQRAGNFKFVGIDRRDGLGGQQRERVDADHHRHVERLVARFGLVVESPKVPRQHEDRHALLRMHLDAVDRHVLYAGRGVARDDQSGRDIRAVVVLAVRRHRQHIAHVAVAVYYLLARCFVRRHFAPGQRLVSRITKALQQFGLGHAHGFGDPGTARHEP